MAKLQVSKEFAETILKGVEYEGKTLFEWVKLISKKDFVEVVRCSECLHFLSDTEHCKKHNKSYCELDNGIKTKNHFCSFGERRSDE